MAHPKPFVVEKQKFMTLDMLEEEHTPYFVGKAIKQLGRDGMGTFPHFMFFTASTLESAVALTLRDGYGPRPMWDQSNLKENLGLYTHHYIASLLGTHAYAVAKVAGTGPFTIEQANEWVNKLRPTTKPRYNEAGRVVELPGGVKVFTLHELAARTGYTHRTVKAFHSEHNLFKGLIQKMPTWVTLILPQKYRQIKDLLKSWPKANTNNVEEKEMP